MEKIRPTILLLGIFACIAGLAAIGSGVVAFGSTQNRIKIAHEELADARSAVAYSCGFNNGQRAMMQTLDNLFPIVSPELDFCPKHRENAAAHGFRQGKHP